MKIGRRVDIHQIAVFKAPFIRVEPKHPELWVTEDREHLVFPVQKALLDNWQKKGSVVDGTEGVKTPIGGARDDSIVLS